MKSSPKPERFLLVGNGPYLNRGCEAIVRGTMETLRAEYGQDVQASAGVCASIQTVNDQAESETDPGIVSFALADGAPRWTKIWWAAQANKRLGASFDVPYRVLRANAPSPAAGLQIGGDNYTLDYGLPRRFMEMDRYLLRQKIPAVIWGASIGPFDSEPAFAKKMFRHLRRLDGLFVRETITQDYLASQGVTENVHLVGDPAFAMTAVEPLAEILGFEMPAQAIGINLSPLVARFRGREGMLHTDTQTDMERWIIFCTSLVRAVAKTLGRPIVLVPHVESPGAVNDDFQLLESVRAELKDQVDVPLYSLPRELRAAEIKWVIARCEVFAGARTHSTLAALSSGVPTLSIGYSSKARGINQDVFGNLCYCLNVSDLTEQSFLDRIQELLRNAGPVRDVLSERIPVIRKRAFHAVRILRELISKDGG